MPEHSVELAKIDWTRTFPGCASSASFARRSTCGCSFWARWRSSFWRAGTLSCRIFRLARRGQPRKPARLGQSTANPVSAGPARSGPEISLAPRGRRGGQRRDGPATGTDRLWSNPNDFMGGRQLGPKDIRVYASVMGDVRLGPRRGGHVPRRGGRTRGRDKDFAGVRALVFRSRIFRPTSRRRCFPPRGSRSFGFSASWAVFSGGSPTSAPPSWAFCGDWSFSSDLSWP